MKGNIDKNNVKMLRAFYDSLFCIKNNIIKQEIILLKEILYNCNNVIEFPFFDRSLYISLWYKNNNYTIRMDKIYIDEQSNNINVMGYTNINECINCELPELYITPVFQNVIHFLYNNNII